MRPVLFQVGGLSVPSYFLLLVLGTCAFVVLTTRAAARRGVTAHQTALLLGAAWVATVIGARLLFVFKQPALRADPLRWIFDPSPGGYAIQGGVVLALLVVVAIAGWLRLPLATVAASAVPGLCVAGVAGRLGCFLAGCCYGRPTAAPWGVEFPAASAPARHWGAGVALHPTQLYEAAFFAVLGVLYVGLGKRRRTSAGPAVRASGAIFTRLLIAYFGFRFAVELFRGDPRMEIWGLTSPQWISLVAIACALVVLKAQRGAEDARVQRDPSVDADRRLPAGLGTLALPVRGAGERG